MQSQSYDCESRQYFLQNVYYITTFIRHWSNLKINIFYIASSENIFYIRHTIWVKSITNTSNRNDQLHAYNFIVCYCKCFSKQRAQVGISSINSYPKHFLCNCVHRTRGHSNLDLMESQTLVWTNILFLYSKLWLY